MRVLLPLLLLAGCPTPSDDTGEVFVDPPPGCFDEDAAVSLTGVGETIVMVHGPQGGWHVEAGASVDHTVPNVQLHFTVRDTVSDVIVSDNNYYVALVSDGCGGDYPDLRGFLDVSELADGDADTPPELLVGHELELMLELTDQEGRTASTATTGVAEPDPADVE